MAKKKLPKRATALKPKARRKKAAPKKAAKKSAAKPAKGAVGGTGGFARS